MPRDRTRASSLYALALPLPILALLAAACGGGSAPGAPSPSGTGAGGTATSAEITPADLRARLTAFAHDSMLGRRSGRLGGVKATELLAGEARRLGLQPAGESGTYFQVVPVVERTLDSAAALTVDGTTLRPWNELIPRDQGKDARPVDGAAAVYGGVWGDSASLLPLDAAAGKLVVLTAAPAPDGTPAGTVNRAQVTDRFRNSAGIVIATLDDIDASGRRSLEEVGAQLAAEIPAHAVPAFVYTTRTGAEAIMGAPLDGMRAGTAGRTVGGQIRFVDRPAPYAVRNVVALLPGSDPALRGEMVAIGAHHDHEGVAPVAEDHDSLRAFNRYLRPEGANSTPGRPTAEQAAGIAAALDSLRKTRPARVDSVFNGADDDGTGSVALLEIAERLARGPAKPKRSVL
ncbi:MAG TPA: M28 family peptidase, partial [Gemmatimonadales bacterium]|nr:M28 family peptidase [Gemmatimonadales bacterium]